MLSSLPQITLGNSSPGGLGQAQGNEMGADALQFSPQKISVFRYCQFKISYLLFLPAKSKKIDLALLARFQQMISCLPGHVHESVFETCPSNERCGHGAGRIIAAGNRESLWSCKKWHTALKRLEFFLKYRVITILKHLCHSDFPVKTDKWTMDWTGMDNHRNFGSETSSAPDFQN